MKKRREPDDVDRCHHGRRADEDCDGCNDEDEDEMDDEDDYFDDEDDE